MHGNYDYITDGVYRWDDADHVLPSSLFYASKPSWFGGVAWPAIGPDVTGQAVQIPAEYRYLDQELPAGEESISANVYDLIKARENIDSRTASYAISFAKVE
jgi:hypothetical protein